MNPPQEPLPTDPRSYESDDGDILPLDGLVDPVGPGSNFTEYSLRKVRDNEVVSDTTRMIQKALADQAIEAQIEADDAYVDAAIEAEKRQTRTETNLDRMGTLEMLHTHDKFFPRNVDEKDSMIGILGRSKRSRNPTVVYLGDIEMKHRKLKSKNPKAAVRSLVGHFEKYAAQAHSEVSFAVTFSEEIERHEIDETRSLLSHFTEDELVNNDHTLRTLTSIVRLIEAERFAETGEGDYSLALRNGVDSKHGKKERFEYIMKVLEPLPFSDIISLNARLQAEETNRFEYWRTHLLRATMINDESIRADILKAVAALDKLKLAPVSVAEST